jgi:hypothetical protein
MEYVIHPDMNVTLNGQVVARCVEEDGDMFVEFFDVQETPLKATFLMYGREWS